jgi:uncharacterized membrane protein
MAQESNHRADGPGPFFEEGPFEPMEALAWGLAVLKAEPERVGLPLVLAGFAIVISGTVIPALLSGIASLLTAAAPQSFLSAAIAVVARLVGAGVSVVVSAYVMTGVYPFVLNVARGRPVQLVDLFRHQDKFARCLGLLCIVSLATTAGSALCVLPGAAVVVFTCMSMLMLVDLDMPVVAALRGSYELVRAHLAPVVVFCLLSFAAILVGALLCFAGAVLVSIPVVFLAQAYVYLRLHGETPVTV